MDSSKTQVALKLLVDKKKNRVVYAEADNDFVGILFSFLTLPVGTIVRLIEKPPNSPKIMVGSLNSLYNSVKNIETQYFSTEACKEMLLQPRNSSEDYCKELKLNLDDTVTMKYFRHRVDDFCKMVSNYKYLKCKCGYLFDKEVELINQLFGYGDIEPNVFVHRSLKYIIRDDLKIIPHVLNKTMKFLGNLGIGKIESMEEMTVNLNLDQILDLLKCSLCSRTPLTDLFLRDNKPFDTVMSEPFNYSLQFIDYNSNASVDGITLKLYRNKLTDRVMFAQADNKFINLLWSILTFPLGGVVNLLSGDSGFWSIDNLYKSVADLGVDKYLLSEVSEKKFIRPKLAKQFLCEDVLFDITEETHCKHFCSFRSLYCGVNDDTWYGQIVDQHNIDSIGFAEAMTLFLVTDDLVVTPIHSLSIISYLESLKVPLIELEEELVTINKKRLIVF